MPPRSRPASLVVLARALLALAAWAALAAPAPRAHAQARFVDATDAVGLRYLQSAPLAEDAPLGEAQRMSGGAAVADVDGDGDLDLAASRLHDHDLLLCNRLAETGRLAFEDCSEEAGLAAVVARSNGLAFGDVDHDGDEDLFVTVLGAPDETENRRDLLWINDGRGRFTEEAVARGADGASPISASRVPFSATFGDVDLDGWLDLVVVEWAAQVPDESRARLLVNRGAEAPGRFVDRTAAAGLDLAPVFGFAAAVEDLDDDGWPDLAVAADFGTNRLWWGAGGGRFVDGTTAAGVGTDENGMGSTIADLDGDGRLDWFVTSIFDPAPPDGGNWGGTGNRLYRNRGGRAFADATDERGVRDGGWGWGAAAFDPDADGDLDLVMTNGVDFPVPVDDAFALDPMRCWRNDGPGPMPEAAEAMGLADLGPGKGLLVWDPDADGDQDLLVVHHPGGALFYRNDAPPGVRWLRVLAVESKVRGHRPALGARVELRAAAGGPVLRRQIGSVSHFLGQGEPHAYFGLGRHEGTVAEVRVRWPDGRARVLTDVAANGTLVVAPEGRAGGAGDTTLWLPLLARGR